LPNQYKYEYSISKSIIHQNPYSRRKSFTQPLSAIYEAIYQFAHLTNPLLLTKKGWHEIQWISHHPL